MRALVGDLWQVLSSAFCIASGNTKLAIVLHHMRPNLRFLVASIYQVILFVCINLMRSVCVGLRTSLIQSGVRSRAVASG